MENNDFNIGVRLGEIGAEIEKARHSSLIGAKKVTLVGVSKFQPREVVEKAIHAGLKIFGENRVQEAHEKFLTLRETYADLELHLIGALQTNKAKQAVALFDVIHTIDSIRLADAIANEIQKQKRDVRCLIQINTGEEAQKAGVAPRDADALIAYCREELKLQLSGVMCIPPADDHPAPHFALLRKIAERHALPWRSMGMSGDYITAVRMGATHVRVGTALFGERKAEV